MSAPIRFEPRYDVVLLNDDDHTYEYVIEMLGHVFGYPVLKAYRMAQEVDSMGRVVVFTAALSVAEAKRDEIHAFGADARLPRSNGPMTAVLEPAAI